MGLLVVVRCLRMAKLLGGMSSVEEERHELWATERHKRKLTAASDGDAERSNGYDIRPSNTS